MSGAGTPYYAPRPIVPAGSGPVWPSTSFANVPQYPPQYAQPAPPVYHGAGHGSDDWGKPGRGIMRTPSPTPSEARALNEKGVGMIDFSAMKTKEYWRDPKNIGLAILAILGIFAGILFVVFEKNIIHALRPAIDWMHDLKFGFLIPIAIFFVISFPPLFGHEVVAILCGLVWGVGEGFAIVAAGTLIGELGNFYAFRYCCRARFEKQEKKSILYACLAKLVREGGFKIALISRYSVIPGHLTTAVYSSCGISVWIFLAAATLSLPKQLVLILVGVMADTSDDGQPAPKSEKLTSAAVFVVTAVITFMAWKYISKELERVKPEVIYQKRKARQAQMFQVGAKGFDPTVSVNIVPVDDVPAESPIRAPRTPGATHANFTRGRHAPFPQQREFV